MSIMNIQGESHSQIEHNGTVRSSTNRLQVVMSSREYVSSEEIERKSGGVDAEILWECYNVDLSVTKCYSTFVKVNVISICILVILISYFVKQALNLYLSVTIKKFCVSTYPINRQKSDLWKKVPPFKECNNTSLSPSQQVSTNVTSHS